VPVKSVQQSSVNVVHTTNLKVGNENFIVTLDTGSSDTWLVATGFKCVNRYRKTPVANSRCKFGPTYNKTSTFSRMPNRHFNTSYVDKSFVSGAMGTETVTLGNITVRGQPMGFIDTAAWEGDGSSSGLMGLAYPSITNAYPGDGPGGDEKGTALPYPPVFTSMHRQKLIAPMFSLALNRPREGPGVLALGGLPAAPIRYGKDFARAPLQHLSVSPRKPPPRGEDGFEDYMFYVVTADGFTVGSQSPAESMKTEVIIDSGSPITFLPKDVVKAIHAKWSPPVARDRLTGQYLFSCKSSTPPKVGVKFNGKTVYFDSEDLKVVASGSLCLSGIQEAKGGKGSAMSILGGSFLKGVVAVFDVGAAEMRFANRIR
jgi:aspergillopepsin I